MSAILKGEKIMAKQVESKDLMTVETVHILNSDFNMYGTIDKPIFLAQDIAEMIKYSLDKVDQMLANVDDDEKLTDTIYRSGQKREMWFLTENGLYELLMQSRKPLAKAFKAEIKKILHQMRTGRLYERPGRFNMITDGNDKVVAVDALGVEFDATKRIFQNPSKKLTEDYITGNFG